MNLLELFSGSQSIGKVACELGFNVISLDLKNADINCDVLEWEYKQEDLYKIPSELICVL